MQWKIEIFWHDYISNRCDIERAFEKLREKYNAIVEEKD